VPEINLLLLVVPAAKNRNNKGFKMVHPRPPDGLIIYGRSRVMKIENDIPYKVSPPHSFRKFPYSSWN
jgi:hypothetical protein